MRLSVPLGLNVCPPFHTISRTMRPASVLSPAKNVIEDELRRNVFWLAYAVERQYVPDQPHSFNHTNSPKDKDSVTAGHKALMIATSRNYFLFRMITSRMGCVLYTAFVDYSLTHICRNLFHQANGSGPIQAIC